MLLLFELQRCGIDAIAQAGRFGAVLEDVPEMGAAAGAMDLGAAREQAIVFFGADVIFDDRLKEARPAGAGIKLGVGTEQVKITGDAPI